MWSNSRGKECVEEQQSDGHGRGTEDARSICEEPALPVHILFFKYVWDRKFNVQKYKKDLL